MKTLPLNTRAPTTALKQPKELFTFARDIDNEWIYDREHIVKEAVSYYYLPDVQINNQIDLQGGYAKFKKIPEEDNLGDFASLLKALEIHEREHGKVGVDIITFRGLMTKILALPYNLLDPIDLNIVAYDGQLFVKSDEELELRRRTESDAKQKAELTPEKYEHVKRCEYSGYKFEAMATIPKPWADCTRPMIDKRNKKIVNNYEQYISAIRTGIGKVKMLLAGEVDCVWDFLPEDGGEPVDHYVELKTSRAIETNGQVITFERKLFKTWAQSFLMGTKKIVYGFRDDLFILKSVEIYETEKIPLLIKNNPLNNVEDAAAPGGRRGPKINCISALKWYGAVLDWISKEIPKDDESMSWRLSYDPGSRTFSLLEIVGEANQKLRNGGILSPEFKQWRQSLKKD